MVSQIVHRLEPGVSPLGYRTIQLLDEYQYRYAVEEFFRVVPSGAYTVAYTLDTGAPPGEGAEGPYLVVLDPFRLPKLVKNSHEHLTVCFLPREWVGRRVFRRVVEE